ncbi:non-canonical purine NTP pyrophosphatase [Chlamydiifrater phoenicopteri]|uniref:non-canonical purine NTP pyrophosphatase n=1 Tax=Chlamydiifrater phoenicopteri TaxID=2681469 RepID=UPI001BCE63E3|nr:non-canonical purine NTP pyrophosphatase [Chlamydiifrater phoenicopteri]
MDIVIVSTNGYKIRATKTFLKDTGSFDVFSLLDFPSYHPHPVEGNSPEEIAFKKAHQASLALGMWAIAETSFLVVPALDGLPGKNSSCFAGPNSSDKDNRQELLRQMAHLSGPVARSAYFECSIILVSPTGEIHKANGCCEGYIADTEKGSGGFGYDPLFFKYDYNLTFAELTEDIKNRVSHRAKALKKLSEVLSTLSQEALTLRE